MSLSCEHSPQISPHRSLTSKNSSVESDIAIRTAGTVAFGRFSLLYTAYVQIDNVSSAILYYDFALTVDTEIERFWGRPWSLVSFGFYLNRYLSLLGHIPVMYELYAPMAQSVSN